MFVKFLLIFILFVESGFGSGGGESGVLASAQEGLPFYEQLDSQASLIEVTLRAAGQSFGPRDAAARYSRDRVYLCMSVYWRMYNDTEPPHRGQATETSVGPSHGEGHNNVSSTSAVPAPPGTTVAGASGSQHDLDQGHPLPPRILVLQRAVPQTLTSDASPAPGTSTHKRRSAAVQSEGEDAAGGDHRAPLPLSQYVNLTYYLMPQGEGLCAEVREAPASHFTAFELAHYLLDESERDSLEVLLVVWTDNKTPVAFDVAIHQLGTEGFAQVYVAAIIMVFTYVFIATEVVHTTLVASVASFVSLLALTLFGKQPSLGKIMSWLEPGTLGLLFGMMIIVSILTATGVFEWAAVRAFEWSDGSVRRLAIILCVVTAVLSAILDNVITVLLIAPVTIRLCNLLDTPFMPLLMAEVLMSKIGGTATLVGDPPNIIIGSVLVEHISFVDFLINMGPGAIFVAIPSLLHILWYYRADIKGRRSLDSEDLRRLYVIKDWRLFYKCCGVFGAVLLMFFLHPVIHVDPAWAALAGAIALLILTSPHDVHSALHKVEWDVLIFFAALFVLVEAVGEMGLLRAVGRAFIELISLVEGKQAQLAFSIVLIIFVSSILSAVVDNVPYTLAMIPVVMALSKDPTLQLPLKPLAWALAWGADLGGNGTLVGATVNIVAASIAKENGQTITFTSFFKVGFPNMLLSCVFASIYCVVVYVGMGIGVGESLYVIEANQ